MYDTPEDETLRGPTASECNTYVLSTCRNSMYLRHEMEFRQLSERSQTVMAHRLSGPGLLSNIRSDQQVSGGAPREDQTSG